MPEGNDAGLQVIDPRAQCLGLLAGGFRVFARRDQSFCQFAGNRRHGIVVSGAGLPGKAPGEIALGGGKSRGGRPARPVEVDARAGELRFGFGEAGLERVALGAERVSVVRENRVDGAGRSRSLCSSASSARPT